MDYVYINNEYTTALFLMFSYALATRHFSETSNFTRDKFVQCSFDIFLTHACSRSPIYSDNNAVIYDHESITARNIYDTRTRIQLGEFLLL